MPQLISIAAQTSPKFDTIIASPFDLGNIQDAFMYYHYGIAEKNQEPAEKSIHSYLKIIKNGTEENQITLNSLTETYNFIESSSGSAKVINDLNVFERLENIKKEIYASFNTKNSSYTLQISDNKKIIVVQAEVLTNIVIPNDSEADFPVGSNMEIINIGQRTVKIIQNSGVNLRGNQKTLQKNSSRANQSRAIYKRASNDWVVIQ